MWTGHDRCTRARRTRRSRWPSVIAGRRRRVIHWRRRVGLPLLSTGWPGHAHRRHSRPSRTSGSQAAVRGRSSYPWPVTSRSHRTHSGSPRRVHPWVHGIHARRSLPPYKFSSFALPGWIHAVRHHWLSRRPVKIISHLRHTYSGPWSGRISWTHERKERGRHRSARHTVVGRHLSYGGWRRSSIMSDTVDSVTAVHKAIVVKSFRFATVFAGISSLGRG